MMMKIKWLFMMALFYSCSGLNDKTQDEFSISFIINREVYKMTDWAEPPQFALWLENDSSKTIKTIFVTQRTAKDKWEGKASCPISLPHWVSKYKQEYNKEFGPDYLDPLPDSYTGATPKQNFSREFEVFGNHWNLYLEVNVSGDYNDYYVRDIYDAFSSDFGNGQPSVIYQTELKNGMNETQFRIIGCTDQYNPGGKLIEDISNHTSALNLIQDAKVERTNDSE
jgi:hypothetical protein